VFVPRFRQAIYRHIDTRIVVLMSSYTDPNAMHAKLRAIPSKREQTLSSPRTFFYSRDFDGTQQTGLYVVIKNDIYNISLFVCNEALVKRLYPPWIKTLSRATVRLPLNWANNHVLPTPCPGSFDKQKPPNSLMFVQK
jgi:hypothetical protein